MTDHYHDRSKNFLAESTVFRRLVVSPRSCLYVKLLWNSSEIEVRSVPTRYFETPESQRRVIGHIATTTMGR